MKKVFAILFTILLLISGCSKTIKKTDIENINKSTKSESEDLIENETNEEDSFDLILSKTNEWIDVNESTVKFLFKAPKKAEIIFYLGTDKENLKEVKRLDSYNYLKGMNIREFVPNKKYFYKIEIKNGEKKKVSKLHSFIKNDWVKKPKNVNWARNAIFYEVFVRSFYDGNNDNIGDLEGLIEKLDYIEELGANAIWLMPITDSPSYHGYDTINYTDINPDYGTIKMFKKLIKEAHKRDIKIVMDLVVNHSGVTHPWFKKALEGKEKYKDYYVWADKFDQINERGEWNQKIWHTKDNDNYYMGIFWDGMPDLNLRNVNLRREIKSISKFWIDLGVDGFRLDAAKHIDHENTKVSHLWWKDFNRYVKSLNPELFLVGENWDNNPNIVAPYFKDMDSSFNFTLSDTIIETVNGNKYVNVIEEINNLRDKYQKYNEDFIDSIFLRNHDQSRIRSVFLNNINKTKLAASIYLTLPGTPFLYYGEEIGMLGKKPDDNIREPFDWYASSKGPGMTSMDIGGFYHDSKYTKANDGISLEESLKDKDSLYYDYKKLIEIRKNNPVFFEGPYESIDLNKSVLSYIVGKDILVIHNNQRKKQKIDISSYISSSSKIIYGEIVLDSFIEIPAYESIIIQK